MKHILLAFASAALLSTGSGCCGGLDGLLFGYGSCGPCATGGCYDAPHAMAAPVASSGCGCDSGCDSGSGSCGQGSCGGCCSPFQGFFDGLFCGHRYGTPCSRGGCGYDGGCDDGCGSCGPFGGPGLFGCGGWGCGEMFWGDFWTSRCDCCDHHGDWMGETDAYPQYGEIEMHEAEPMPAPSKMKSRPMPSPEAVDGSQARSVQKKPVRQVRSRFDSEAAARTAQQTEWKPRRPRY
jgi:hypothetical protein